jgi:aerobic-type carbon monoxide dehydrogenase small subunit (CoxS/CutS family)
LSTQRITLTVNGGNIEFDAPPRKLLSDALREDCGLTGTHVAASTASAAPAPCSWTAARSAPA